MGLIPGVNCPDAAEILACWQTQIDARQPETVKRNVANLRADRREVREEYYRGRASLQTIASAYQVSKVTVRTVLREKAAQA